METINVKDLFIKAEDELQQAHKEMYHPEEDVVAYSACVFSRRALYRYLNCLYLVYAEESNDPVREEQTLEDLYEYCKQKDPSILDIDISSVNCRCKDVTDEDDNEIYYCDINKVSHCMDLASQMREYLMGKTDGNLKN